MINNTIIKTQCILIKNSHDFLRIGGIEKITKPIKAISITSPSVLYSEWTQRSIDKIIVEKPKNLCHTSALSKLTPKIKLINPFLQPNSIVKTIFQNIFINKLKYKIYQDYALLLRLYGLNVCNHERAQN